MRLRESSSGLLMGASFGFRVQRLTLRERTRVDASPVANPSFVVLPHGSESPLEGVLSSVRLKSSVSAS